MNFNMYVYINANQLLKKGFNMKWGISKLALRGTQTKAISPKHSRTLNTRNDTAVSVPGDEKYGRELRTDGNI